MFSEWYKPGCTLEYPLHGSGAVIDALVRGLKKFGGRLTLKSHVESIVVDQGQAIGVKLRNGQVSKYWLISKGFEAVTSILVLIWFQKLNSITFVAVHTC